MATYTKSAPNAMAAAPRTSSAARTSATIRTASARTKHLTTHTPRLFSGSRFMTLSAATPSRQIQTERDEYDGYDAGNEPRQERFVTVFSEKARDDDERPGHHSRRSRQPGASVMT